MFDVVSFLKDNGINYWESGKNVQKGWVNITCPKCGDNSNHGGFNIEKSYYHCWVCGHSRLEEIISELLKISFRESKKIINDYQGLVLRKKKKEKKVKELELPGSLLKRMHKRYLENRNFNPDYIEKKYKIRGTGIIGELKYRIIIPIIFKNEIVSYQARDITDKQYLRYKTLSKEKSILNPKSILYNVDNCNSDSVGVVEGVFDCWRMGDNFVATLGISISDSQLRMFKNYKNVFFLFDNEKEALKKAEKASAYLCINKRINVEIISIDKKDPAELSQQEANYIKKELGL